MNDLRRSTALLWALFLRWVVAPPFAIGALAVALCLVAPWFLDPADVGIAHCAPSYGPPLPTAPVFASDDDWLWSRPLRPTCEWHERFAAHVLELPSAGFAILEAIVAMLLAGVAMRFAARRDTVADTSGRALLLRSFRDDVPNAPDDGQPGPIEALRWTERLVDRLTAPSRVRHVCAELEALGPIVLLSRPGQVLPGMGVGTEAIIGASWKAEIRPFIERARWTVAYVASAPTPGFVWELQTVRELACEHKLLLVVAPGRRAACWTHASTIPWLREILATGERARVEASAVVRLKGRDGTVEPFESIEEAVHALRSESAPSEGSS